MVTVTAPSSFARSCASPASFGFFAKVRLALLLHDLAVGVGCRHRQPFGQQEIARITGGDLHHFAAASEFIDIFPKNDFHG